MKKKYKFMCVWSDPDVSFTKGKIYTSDFENGKGFIDDRGHQYDYLQYDKFFGAKFVYVEKLVFKRICVKTPVERRYAYTQGKSYFIELDNGCLYIYDDEGIKQKLGMVLLDSRCEFKIVENYKLKKEEEKKMTKEMTKEMTSLEKNGLVKGTGETMVQDMFRAVTNKQNGLVQFNPVKMVNISFVKFDANSKIYAFRNPGDKRLLRGSKVRVNTVNGEKDAYVESSIKIQNKYLDSLLYITSGLNNLKLKDIIGIYKKKTVKVEQEFLEEVA